MAARSPRLSWSDRKAFGKIVRHEQPGLSTFEDVRSSMIRDGVVIPEPPLAPTSWEYKKSAVIPRWGKGLLIGTVVFGVAGGIAGLKAIEKRSEAARRHTAVAAARVALADPGRLAQVGACARDIRYAIEYYTQPGATSVDNDLSLPAYEAAATLASQHAVSCWPQDLDPQSRPGVTTVYVDGRWIEMNKNRVLYPTLKQS